MSSTLVFGFYGRSGQGVETAVRLFSKAAFMSGFYVQSFSFIGRGRRAFPVRGFVKLDKYPIESRQVEEPDFCLVFDPALGMGAKRFREKSTVLFNSPEKVGYPQLKRRKVRALFVDATGIALTHLKSNIPNTAMLGGLAKLFPKVTIKSIKMSMEMPKENIAAFDEGYKTVK